MDATSVTLLAAVAVVMSFNLTASLMCSRRLERRVDRLEDRLDQRFDRLEQRFDRLEQRFDRLEQTMAQLALDVAQIKGHLGIAASQPPVTPHPAPQ